ncbi:MAG TPA: class I SAM-dependent methyltransferase [Gemmatimonadaceae bacterium]|nr:class I SAM-dependent methyltransferase [Gemmatimonadaceae bacterium]
MPSTSFDKRFFDKWYRGNDERFRAGAYLERHARVVLAIAEYLLERRVRSVLDVGCGEGEWRAVMRKLRPGMRYAGMDTSEYVVRRFGARRNVAFGGFGDLGARDDLESFDVVLSVDTLHYVPTGDIARGARVLGRRMTGVAMLHAFARGDAYEGDTGGITNRPAAWYRDTFRRAGLTPVGMACWVGRTLRDSVSALERA